MRVRGFTLLELVLVLALLALAATIVAVNMDALVPSSELASAAQRIMATIAHARAEAALAGADGAVEYDFSAKCVRALVPAPRRTDGRAPELVTSDFRADLPEGVALEAVLVSAGRPSSRGTLRIKVRHAGGMTAHVVHLAGGDGLVYSIEVHGPTGLATLHDRRVAPPAALVDKPQ